MLRSWTGFVAQEGVIYHIWDHFSAKSTWRC